MATCPSTNTANTEQDDFWSGGTFHWDAHRIGWTVSGACAAVATLLSLLNAYLHAANFTCKAEQRQIIRIVMMPAVYGIIAFFSYRFFRAYTYYSLTETVYEALALGAFMLLLVQYIGSDPERQREALASKEKRKVPFPLCCFRMRPSKPYFIYTVVFMVLQYCFVRPILTIVGIICEAYNILCIGTYSVHFAAVYIDAIDFVSISIALEGLIIFYAITKDQLQGRGPLRKFLSLKAIVFFTFYQSFVFSILSDHGVLKATEYYTTTNIADGLNALATSIEMVVFALYNFWAFRHTEYARLRGKQEHHTSVTSAFLLASNPSDYFAYTWICLKFFGNAMGGQSSSLSKSGLDSDQHTIASAFQVEGAQPRRAYASYGEEVEELDETKSLQSMQTHQTQATSAYDRPFSATSHTPYKVPQSSSVPLQSRQ
ncbi:uncharacterized protein L969DRAFT_92027 [Mixia osmundae IAM 14324]|uniref:DUF300-domain-containing protein n=1 Tax=Mixia osmundae (strain CBS 9802 / IAM 14324 / JCM 22182 / KY 12970) TaxID=764103 RepID=G7DZD3_MIXOS|nr:uncharacterized protein L969DRAFT_92027 [Mixia osmundae IAM 14324]KEI42592.1 hypothetical protein L969DRAFT_92027 [Mixia osmundae IAM 14324]GAA95943.1 hypothetical protein E5Q_02601 [Mixia osmundae IAM 14324]